jgi:branched-chain amino acid transport system substrate-binding protein
MFILLLIISSCSKSVEKSAQIRVNEFVIGDLNTNPKLKQYSQHYYAGMFLAINEINKSGFLPVPLRLVIKDSYNNQQRAYNQARELVEKEGVLILSGTYLPQPAIGIAKYASDNQVPFIATGVHLDELITGNVASEYVFRLNSSDDINVKAIANHIIKNRAITDLTIIRNSNYHGDSISNLIRDKILPYRDNIKFSPDIIVNKNNISQKSLADEAYGSFTSTILIAVDRADIQPLVLNLQKNKALISKRVYILYGGEPEWLDNLGNLTPKNWIATGFPWYAINNPKNLNFVKNYQANYAYKPRLASYMGYINVYMIAQAIKDSKIIDNSLSSKKKLAETIKGIKIDSPIGLISIRSDNQSTLGAYVGVLGEYIIQKEKMGKLYQIMDIRMSNSEYLGEEYFEDLGYILSQRQEAMKYSSGKFGNRPVKEIKER